MRVRYPRILALALTLLAVATTARATNFGYSATLNSASEVPTNASPATGMAILVYDDVANTLTTNITFSGLVGTTTASHIHGPAAPGANAGVVRAFAATPTGVTSGSYQDVWTGLTATQVNNLNAGLLYVNLHSSAFPGGEIRGQITSSPTPTARTTWSRVRSLYR